MAKREQKAPQPKMRDAAPPPKVLDRAPQPKVRQTKIDRNSENVTFFDMIRSLRA